MKKETKESLAIELARIRDSHSGWVSGDERRRNEFAKAFNWYEPIGQYNREPQIKIPSWEQIFVELGKLLATRNFYDCEGNISRLECKLEDLEKKIRSEIHPT